MISRNEQPPPPKVDPRKAALFNQVLGNVTGLPPEPPAPEATPESTAPSEAEVTAAAAADGNAAAPVEAKPKGRKKAKA